MPLLAQTTKLRDSLADHLAQFVWAAEPDGQAIYCNPHWYAFTGLTEAESLPDGWASAVHPDDLPSLQAGWEQNRTGGIAYRYEARFRRADGAYRWHLAEVAPVRDEDGQIVRWVGSATDIEERKRTEAALREADRRKDDFLAVLGHELRGPLAPLRSGLEVLKRAGRDLEVSTPTLAMMERQMADLVRLVDDLLDISRMNRGKVKLRHEPLDLRETCGRAAETVRPLIDACGHTLAVELPAEPLPVTGDSARLTQVAVNLVHNAAKYTEDGGRIRLTAGRDGEAAVLTVCDTGIGIQPDVLPTVFDLFSQGERGVDRARGGLGIGLAVVKSLVELHGGTVTAHSDGPGCGSTFTVRLPVADGGLRMAELRGHTPNPPSEIRNPKSLRVLVVDDNADTARLTCILLKLSGHGASSAYDGLAAVAVAESFQPDVVLLDIGLPGLNGYEVAGKIRGLPGLAGVKIVAVTGFGHEDDRRRSEAAGFVGHLVKPVEPAALEEVIGRLAGS